MCKILLLKVKFAAKVILLFEMRKKIVNKITAFVIKMINTIIL